MSNPPVVLFDGVCNVCNSAVNFIIDRDPRGLYRFASLQSEAGKKLCEEHGVPLDVATLVLVDGGSAYTESTAMLRVLRGLSGLWAVLYAFVVVPRPLRNWMYRYFADHRYEWFGKKEQCRIPTPEIRARFL